MIPEEWQKSYSTCGITFFIVERNLLEKITSKTGKKRQNQGSFVEKIRLSGIRELLIKTNY